METNLILLRKKDLIGNLIKLKNYAQHCIILYGGLRYEYEHFSFKY